MQVSGARSLVPICCHNVPKCCHKTIFKEYLRIPRVMLSNRQSTLQQTRMKKELKEKFSELKARVAEHEAKLSKEIRTSK